LGDCGSLMVGVVMKYILIVLLLINIGWSEDRIKIGIIDSGISIVQAENPILCRNGLKSFVPDSSGYDSHGHGTNIFGLVSSGLDSKKYCIVSYKVWNYDITARQSLQYTIKALKQANIDGLSYLNISMSGGGYEHKEFLELEKITHKTMVIVASGNENRDLDNICDIYPACYGTILSKNFYSVGAIDTESSNYGSIVTCYTKGLQMGTPVLSGTSQATAYFTNFLIKNNKNMVYKRKEGKNVRPNCF